MTGIKGKYVSCARNPCDLRPVADAVDAIVMREAPKATPEKPLVILMGESHATTSHKLLQQLVMTRLKDRGIAFGFGYEYPHNLIDQVVKKQNLQADAKSLRFYRDHCALLAMVHWDRPYAPYTRNNLLRFCDANRISLHFNDAARDNKTMDVTDLYTLDMMRRVVGRTVESESVGSPDGMKLRNHIMVARAMEAIRTENLPVYVQHCGFSHVYGQTENGRVLFEDGLYNQFSKTGATVLPVVHLYDIHHVHADMPLEAADAISASVVAKRMDYFHFFSKERAPLRALKSRPQEQWVLDLIKKVPPYLNPPKPEKEWVAHIAAQSGHEIKIYPDDTWHAWWKIRYPQYAG